MCRGRIFTLQGNAGATDHALFGGDRLSDRHRVPLSMLLFALSMEAVGILFGKDFQKIGVANWQKKRKKSARALYGTADGKTECRCLRYAAAGVSKGSELQAREALWKKQ